MLLVPGTRGSTYSSIYSVVRRIRGVGPVLSCSKTRHQEMERVVVRRGCLRSSAGATLSVLLLLAFHRVGADDPSPPVWPGRFHATLSQDRDGDLGIADLWYDYAAGRNLNVIQSQSAEEDGPLFDNECANGTGYYYLPAKAKAKYCNIIDFGVGILKPDWLAGATYLGEEKVGIYDCYKWEQGEIPEAHLKFLGLPPAASKEESDQASAKAGEFQQRDGAGVSLRGEGVRDQEVGEERGGGGEGGAEGRFMTYWSEKGTDRPVKWVFFSGGIFEVIRFDPGATMPDDLFQLPDYCFSGEDADEEGLPSVEVVGS